MEETRKYKQTELGLLPEDWEVVKLGEIGELAMCKRIFQNETSEMGDVPFYKIGTFGKTPDAYISYAKYLEFKSAYRFPNEGDILISAAGTIGRIVVYDGKPAYFQDSNIVWLAHNGKTLRNDFLFYVYQITDWNTENTTIARLYNDNFNKTTIPLPPIEEQHRIASALTSIDNLIDSLDRLIAKKRDIKQGAMQQLLSGKKRLKGFTEPWMEKKLGDVVTNSIGLTYSPNNVKKYGTLVLRSSNIKNGKLIFEDNVFVEMSIPERAKVHTNDLLVCVRNGSKALIGKSAVITEDAEGMAFGAFMTILRANGIEQIFLNYYWQTDFIQKQVRDNMGATINQITNADISDFDIYVPSSLPEQQAIASILTSMDNELSALEAKRKKYEQIKRGMMQQLLTGKIRLAQ